MRQVETKTKPNGFEIELPLIRREGVNGYVFDLKPMFDATDILRAAGVRHDEQGSGTRRPSQ